MTPRLTTDYAKNYCNRTLIVKVIVVNVVTCFLWDAVYKWIELVVAEIWPFEIIQDGGLPPTWICCNRK